jgi:hypothetical protein
MQTYSLETTGAGLKRSGRKVAQSLLASAEVIELA